MAIKIGHSQKVSRLELHAPVKIVTDVFLPSVNNALEFEMHKWCEFQSMTFNISELLKCLLDMEPG